jgi:hypothetical protein
VGVKPSIVSIQCYFVHYVHGVHCACHPHGWSIISIVSTQVAPRLHHGHEGKATHTLFLIKGRSIHIVKWRLSRLFSLLNIGLNQPLCRSSNNVGINYNGTSQHERYGRRAALLNIGASLALSASFVLDL